MVQGPNDLEALKNPLPAPPVNTVAGNEAQNRRNRQNGTETPLAQPVDTVQLSQRAMQAAANRSAVAGAADTAPVAGVPLNPAPPAAFPTAPHPLPAAPGAGAPATVVAANTPLPRALAQAWASSPAREALQNEPEVRPDRVAQAAQRLAALDSEGGGAVNAQIAEKLLTGI